MSIRLYKTNRSPSLFDTIKVNGAAFDLTGSTVKLMMRLENSSTLKVDTAAVILQTGTDPNFVDKGEIRYDWAALDVDTAGDYVAWWRVTLPSTKTQDTSEFQVEILEHAAAVPALCSLADVREILELPASETSRDQMIESTIIDVSTHIIREYEREFAPAVSAVTRRFEVDAQRRLNGGVHLDLSPYDLRTVTTVSLNPEDSPTVLIAGTDYALRPTLARDGVYTSILLSYSQTFSSTIQRNFGTSYLDITGAWGFAAVPEQVRRATAETVASMLRRDFATLVASGNVDARDILPLRDMVIPATARRMLRPFQRNSGAF